MTTTPACAVCEGPVEPGATWCSWPCRNLDDRHDDGHDDTDSGDAA